MNTHGHHISESRELIRTKIEALRIKRGVVWSDVKSVTNSEISGYAVAGGEIGMLVERQLMITSYGHGGWGELNDADIVTAVLKYVDHELAA